MISTKDKDDVAFLEGKAYQCAVREEGEAHALRYLHQLRDRKIMATGATLLEAPEAFYDSDLHDIVKAQFARQKVTGKTTRAFWGLGPDDAWEFMTTEEVMAMRAEIDNDPEIQAEEEWDEKLVRSTRLLHQEIEPRRPLVRHNGVPVFLESSINQIFAYRGLGKSIVALMLAKLFTQGGEWLGFKSDGNHDVLLIDAELPAAQLQERIKEFVGMGNYKNGTLRIWSPEFAEFPDFGKGEKTGQIHPLGHALKALKPKVVIFDTLTRCFKMDTNDTEQCLRVNDVLINLRQMGLCVIVVHHAGKNQTQRGRTDLDDNLDISIKLDKPYGWLPGDGLAFKWGYEKVRHGGYLQDFEASYNGSEWSVCEDSRQAEVLELSRSGKSQRAIATALDMSQPTVNRILKRAEQAGLERLNQKKKS